MYFLYVTCFQGFNIITQRKCPSLSTMYRIEGCKDLQSIESKEKVYVRFKNCTDRMVELLWIDFTGCFKRYHLLRKDQFVDINTFKTHPWMAVDVHTKDRLHIAKRFRYMPTPCAQIFLRMYPVVPVKRRVVVAITLPVHSLRYQALLTVKNYFRNPNDVDVLDIPQNVRDDLKKLIIIRNKFVLIPSF